uniref:Uncharacterized protein n=1 Tax=Pseudictyota dubia TaxID=2749911 RepID=A0A6U2G1Y4_9STRA|mmetsp:Transcript_41284/g.76283  ORF Transcript_41284/g.76283 Transcript_41284/m.76283 type:complete len:188 (+) Transcript_41284:85-648(+)|eukprot:CAMPEP_0197454370 /NCGR_PEP_ID=MMETSP1175-20131217/37757_1 /TAXON_ID=1003142 /ORGANISM="Triceratium dubium, Strain CCMP147" /LENGTH=187 /DNA_ID=CAMNT_0042987943 /DNA_START=76 /DNA_END=642 /DNA_ORIENTATION=+
MISFTLKVLAAFVGLAFVASEPFTGLGTVSCAGGWSCNLSGSGTFGDSAESVDCTGVVSAAEAIEADVAEGCTVDCTGECNFVAASEVHDQPPADEKVTLAANDLTAQTVGPNNETTTDDSSALDKIEDALDNAQNIVDDAQDAQDKVDEVFNTPPNEWTRNQKIGVGVGVGVAVLILLCVLKCLCC